MTTSLVIASDIASVRRWWAEGRGAVGFVPTMGALHDGHLALVRRAATENERVVVSIFVNPAQFDDPRDLERYPRDLERDAALLAGAGCDVLFAPSPEEMYPADFDTWVVPGMVAEVLEGAARPGHFKGVCTIVLKLLNIVRADRMYMGQKDAQQVSVVERMVIDLSVPVDVIAHPTVREVDGLAMSSRNARLSRSERAAAPVLYRALVAARDEMAGGERDAERLRERMREVIAAQPLIEQEYLSVANPLTLRELDNVSGEALLSLAARIGAVRLIDNLRVPAQAARADNART